MSSNSLDPELQSRLKLVADPSYEGEQLNKTDFVLLLLVGIVIPLILMVWGWFE